jgi:rod shape-determining protein MreC
MENQYLQAELSTADRARSLAIFQAHSPSKTVAAHIIGDTAGTGAKVVTIDRGSNSGIQPGMGVITPDGIAGKVVMVFSVSSFVLLATDQTFAAGVMSQNNRVHGTLKGLGYDGTGKIEHVQNEQKVDQGEWFYTSGDDRIFPKGLPVGEVTTVHQGKTEKEIFVSLSGFKNGQEEVLIIVEGVHATIPDAPVANQTVHLLAPPPPDAVGVAPMVQPLQTGPVSTDADRVKEKYRKLGEQEGHVYGERSNGAPNYNAPAKAEPKPDKP